MSLITTHSDVAVDDTMLRSDPDAIHHRFTQALIDHPLDAGVAYDYALVLARLGDDARALGMLRRAVEHDPEVASWACGEPAFEHLRTAEDWPCDLAAGDTGPT